MAIKKNSETKNYIDFVYVLLNNYVNILQLR